MMEGEPQAWLLLLSAIVASPAPAADFEEVYLFRRCASVPAAAAAADGVCANYVYGVLNQLPFGPSRNTCFPRVLTPSQASAIIGNYVRNHPERVGLGAATLTAEAFNSAFPCRSN